MLYRIPMDRGGLSECKIVFPKTEQAPHCKEHGAMNAVAKIEKNGKTYLWYRCLRCRIGVAYDLCPDTNQEYLLTCEKRPLNIEGNAKAPLPEHEFLRTLEKESIQYTVVGTYVLKQHGYAIKPNDLDVVVEAKDLKRAESIAKGYEDVEVHVGKVMGNMLTVKDFKEVVLSRHMFDDTYLQKLARHILDDTRLMDLFNDTEIMFVLESMVKEIKGVLEKREG